MRESTIEKAVCAYAKLKGCLIVKLAGQNQRGQPDRLFIRSGRCLFVEFKAPGKHPTALLTIGFLNARMPKVEASAST